MAGPESPPSTPPPPQGKVVFVAPTKPLVAQQEDACHSFMGMSRDSFCELTGAHAAFGGDSGAGGAGGGGIWIAQHGLAWAGWAALSFLCITALASLCCCHTAHFTYLPPPPPLHTHTLTSLPVPPPAGNTKAEARKELWQGGAKRCFFCTPQTFWNDVRRGEQQQWLADGGGAGGRLGSCTSCSSSSWTQ